MNRQHTLISWATTLGATTACFTGCEPEKSATASHAQVVPPPHVIAPVPVVASPPQKTVVKPDDVFLHPTPSDAGHHPSVIAAEAATDTVKQSLALVHNRLADLKSAYETKVQTQDDLRQVARQMQPLITAAQADCDAILRAARNLKFEYAFVRSGYEATAELYRARSRKFRDLEFRAVELAMATEFDHQAEDVPRRVRLTSDFIEQLIETQEFLAETDRCLRDTTAALAILSAGPDMPRVGPQGRTFRRRLEEFITVVEEFQKKLLTPAPRQGPVPRPATTEQPNGGVTQPPPQAPKATEEAPPPPPPVPVTPEPTAIPISTIVPTSVLRRATPADFLQPGVTLKGRTVHAGIVTPATLWVRERVGDEIAGDIAFATTNGPGSRRFRGRIQAGGEIVLRGDRVQGTILPSSCFYQGYVYRSTIEGSWTCGNVTGSFWFSTEPLPLSYRTPQAQTIAVGPRTVAPRTFSRPR